MSADRRAGRALVIVPTFNERGSIRDIVSRIRCVVPDADLLIVDDASPDGTGAIADHLARVDPQVRVLHRSGKLGLGSAYIAGFRLACAGDYAYAVEMDADGSHLPEQLPDLLLAAESGRAPGSGGTPGLVIGARWIPGGRIVGWPWYRRAISRTGTAVARAVLRSHLHDITSGFRVIRTDWLDRIDLDRVASQGYGFQVEIAWTLERSGCPIVEVPIDFVERGSGRSKMTVGIVAEALRRVLVWGWRFRTRPELLLGVAPEEDGAEG